MAFCRRLHSARSRREAHAFLVEGARLATEALDAGLDPNLVLVDRAALERTEPGQALLERVSPLPVSYDASPDVISAAAETRTPQGIVLVFSEPSPVPVDRASGRQLLLVLDSVADAGNAGAILRSARATGLDTVAFAGDTVDPWLGKVLRAGMGAHFQLSIIHAPWDELSPRVSGYDQVLAADARGGKSLYDVDWALPTALVVGSEAHGLSPDAQNLRSAGVHIPMSGGVESLNAAIAASVILFHATRPGTTRRTWAESVTTND